LTLKLNLRYQLSHLMWSGLDLLFPPACGGCGKLGERWCETCQQTIKPLNGMVCRICGEPQNNAEMCKECKMAQPPYKILRSWAAFDGPIRTALHKLKYRRDIGLGEALALPLAKYIHAFDWRIDTLIPVPLSRQRLSERGYNQVALIAQPLATICQWKYLPSALQRVKHTHSQVGLNIKQRQENVQNAFRANSHFVLNKRILLLDDVTTTGATLISASTALLQAGAANVHAFTVARAVSRLKLNIA